MVPIVHLLLIIKNAHPAIGGALDMFGPVRKHTRYGFGGAYPRLNHLNPLNTMKYETHVPNLEMTKNAMQIELHTTGVNMCVRQMHII
jgi:hypothetical protein